MGAEKSLVKSEMASSTFHESLNAGFEKNAFIPPCKILSNEHDSDLPVRDHARTRGHSRLSVGNNALQTKGISME